jgi:hypothetical protein
VKFRCGTSGAVTVKITAKDLAGNSSEITQDFPAAGASQTSTAFAPPDLSSPSVTPNPAGGAPPAGGGIIPVQNTGSSASSLLPAPDLTGGAGPIAPPISPPISPPVFPAVTPPPTPPSTQPAQPVSAPNPADQQPAPSRESSVYPPVVPAVGAHSVGGTGGATDVQQPLPTVDPKAPSGGALATQGSGGSGGWSAAPPSDAPRAQVINYSRFDIGYDLEQRGPSGISRIDLWVTRDGGQTWRLWDRPDGKNGLVRVTLDVQQNAQQLEGAYGFKLVPVSGAGLSERAPVAGDTPDMRVILDVTPPQLTMYWPVSDPNNPDTLIIKWQATDKNFGDDPITLEWSESAAGPWHPIAASDPVVQATAVSAPVVKRLANTGQYGWRVPPGTPPRVYLKATARDAAGNVTERVTQEPITVDLTKPRARISGIVQPSGPHQ